MTIKVNNQTLYEVSVNALVDKEPVYVKFPNDAMPPQWGVTDKDRHVTIHKDLILRFTDKCKYYVLSEGTSPNIEKSECGNIIKMNF